MNAIDDFLAMLDARPNIYDMDNKLDCFVITLYRPHFPDNDKSWHIFEDDDIILTFLKSEAQESSIVINLEQNRYPKGLPPL